MEVKVEMEMEIEGGSVHQRGACTQGDAKGVGTAKVTD